MKEITKDMTMFWLGSTQGYESNQETESNAYDVVWELLSGGGSLEQYQEDVIETWEEMKKITTNKGEIKMENNTLKQAQADIEAMDMLKDGLIEETNNDTTRDIAIRCTDRLVKGGIIKDCTDTNDDTEFRVQDIIHEEINKALRGV